jgi:hypothetical protein
MEFVINKEELKIWIAALRSGEYIQGKDCLQYENRYCCLGVACMVLIPKDKLVLDIYDNISGVAPDDQPHSPDWLINISSDVFKKYGEGLMNLNDIKEWSFNQIADLLEKIYLTES